MSTKDGGSAFPKQPAFHMLDGATAVYEQEGMSLRDYFAAAALQGMLACSRSTQTCDTVQQNTIAAAEWAYEYADAMLAAREKS